MKYLKHTVLAFILLFSTNLSAQKVVQVCGEYTCRAPKNVSLEQAE